MRSPPLVKETCLYVSDLARSVNFYCGLFGFEIIESQPRFCALSVAGQHILLLFLQGASLAPTKINGGVIPPHDSAGPAHVGFSIPPDELPGWEKLFQERGILVEGRMEWPRGGNSVYFRDPDHHLLELLTPGVWSIF